MNQDELVLNVDDLCVQFIIDGVVVEAVNGFLSEIALDFDAVAGEFTPKGNVTERHVCQAYRMKAEQVLGAGVKEYWQEKIGSFEEDPVKLEALIKNYKGTLDQI